MTKSKKYASDFTPKAIRYAFDGHFVRGEINLVVGKKGTLKSQQAADRIACAITGRPLYGVAAVSPDFLGRKVMLISGERDPQMFAIPRLIAAGVDDVEKKVLLPKKIHTLDGCADAIEAAIKAGERLGLVEIDPLNAFGGARGNVRARLQR
jgi:hypothetical protein